MFACYFHSTRVFGICLFLFAKFIIPYLPLFYHSVNVPFYYTTLRHKKQWFFAVLLCMRGVRVELWCLCPNNSAPHLIMRGGIICIYNNVFDIERVLRLWFDLKTEIPVNASNMFRVIIFFMAIDLLVLFYRCNFAIFYFVYGIYLIKNNLIMRGNYNNCVFFFSIPIYNLNKLNSVIVV